MLRSSWRSLFVRCGVTVCALLSLMLAASGGEKIPTAADGTTVILLTNGRVVTGRVGLNAGGYMVRNETGSVFVPFDRVQLRASDLPDAYRRLLASYVNPSPITHVGLARWCLAHQLYDETKIELRAALAADPTYAEARNMLRRLEEILEPTRAAQPVEEKDEPTADGFQSAPATSLAGLPGDAARDFVTRVQPLMMNSCALAGCHTEGDRSAFQLERVHIGRRSSRIRTERNLAATLRYVDRDHPDNSPLLRVPRGSHGRGGRPIFAGYKGDEHLELLRQWVRQVTPASGRPVSATAARQRPAAIRKDAATGASRAAAHVFPAGAVATPEPGSPSEPGFTVQPKRPAPSATPGLAADESLDDITGGDALLEAILQQERRDAFDPDEFNGQTSGRPR